MRSGRPAQRLDDEQRVTAGAGVDVRGEAGTARGGGGSATADGASGYVDPDGHLRQRREGVCASSARTVATTSSRAGPGCRAR